MTPHDLAVAAATAASDKLGTETLIIDVSGVLGICDYFVIVSGRNKRQVRAIAHEVEEQLWLGLDRKPIAVEGADTNEWVLVDYGDIVVHVFDDDHRTYYRLDRLYGDAPTEVWTAQPDDTGSLDT
jgi:ribosome-associated protein